MVVAGIAKDETDETDIHQALQPICSLADRSVVQAPQERIWIRLEGRQFQLKSRDFILSTIIFSNRPVYTAARMDTVVAVRTCIYLLSLVQGHESSHDGTGYHQIRTNKDKDKDKDVSIFSVSLCICPATHASLPYLHISLPYNPILFLVTSAFVGFLTGPSLKRKRTHEFLHTCI